MVLGDSKKIDCPYFIFHEREKKMKEEIRVVKYEDAIKYGPKAAFILYHIRFWINNNKKNDVNYKTIVIDDEEIGVHWYYESTATLQSKFFSFLSVGEINRALSILIENRVLIRRTFSGGIYNRTYWYALEEDILCAKKNKKYGNKC